MKQPAHAKLPGHIAANPILRCLLLVLLLVGLTAIQSARAQSFALSNLWSMASNDGGFLNTTNHLTRGLAYNPVSGHLLVASRTPLPTVTNAIYVLDGTNGTILGTLPFDANLIKGGNFVINMIGVTDDGVIYVGNLTTDTTNAANGPFRLYRWANESAQPTLAYSGDPSLTNTVGSSPRRFGDTLALRGTGTGTQILLGTLNQLVALLTTTDGINFTSTKITTDAITTPGGQEETRRCLAWGAGNTFWAKTVTGNLRQFSLNLGNQTASNIASIAMSGVYAEGLDVDVSRNLALLVCTNHTLLLYDIINPAAPVQQDTTKTFPTPTRGNANWVGCAALRSGKVFGLDVNNGILAYWINEVYLPPSIKTQPTGVTIWEGAACWTFSVGAAGNRGETLAYQWRFGGTNIAGATASSLTLTNIAITHQGYYSVVVSNVSGTVTSSSVLMTVVSSNPSDQMTNVWNIAADTRPYLTSGYKEYGVAINPQTTNVIVLTRLNPTNMVAVVDIQTGAHKYYIDYTRNPGVTLAGANKICVADDGVIFIGNSSGSITPTTPYIIYGLLDDNETPTQTGKLFEGDPGNGVLSTNIGWGANIDARGGGMDTEILIGAGKWSATAYDANAVAILRYNESMSAFVSTPIVITNLAVGNNNFRFGLCWGAGDSFWAKGLSSLMYVQFDLASGKGWVQKSYPTTGNRSVPANCTAMAYDADTALIVTLLNGTSPLPVSTLFYDVSDPATGPFWVDQELFTSYNADIEYQGSVSFEKGYAVALGVNNGLKAFRVNSSFAGSLPVIVTQPSGGTWFEGSSPTMSVVADANSTLSYQWYYYGTQAIAGATSASLTVTNIQASQAGDYIVRVSTSGGSRDSRAATIVTLPLYNTAQMTNLWWATAGSRPYLNTGYFEYGMAFNPANSNLLVASWGSTNSPTTIIAVMDALTGAHKHVLDITAITNGGNRAVNKVGVADDGVVYVANRTTTPATVPFVVYRWANDAAATVATEAFKDDPFVTMIPSASKNCGWTMDVRGAGVNTEILLSTALTNVVSILTTTDGTNFTANEVLVTGASAAFARLGICFGAGNTLWGKAWQSQGGQLCLVQYDLATHTGTVLKTYDTTQVSSTMTTIAYNDSLKFLAGMARDDQANVQVYSVSDLDYGPVLLDQELFPTYNPEIEANGALDFGGNTYVFALNENNGVMAFRLDASYLPPVTHFKILSVAPSGADVILTWQAQSGTTYQVQYADSVVGTPRTNWTTLGSVVATGSTASFTNTASASKRFYQVIAQ